MKKQNYTWVALLVCAVLSAAGQPPERDAPRHTHTSLNRGNWIGRRVMTPEFMEKVGIKGEQAAKLKAELDVLDRQTAKLDAEITQAALEQAELAKKVLSEPGANTDGLMKMVERIGNCRTEQAKLATRRLVVMRDNLTAEQREKASAMLNEEQKKWHEERNAQPNRGAAAPPRPTVPKGW